jgi:hypothetical protein
VIDAVSMSLSRSCSFQKPHRGLRATISFNTSITDRYRSMLDAGRRYQAVRDSFTRLQARAIDTPCSLTRISAACRFTDGTTVFGSEHP